MSAALPHWHSQWHGGDSRPYDSNIFAAAKRTRMSDAMVRRETRPDAKVEAAFMTRRFLSSVLIAMIVSATAAGESPSPGETVSCHDVVYTSLSKEPWEAMPTGGGDLSAMVRCDGDVHLHLSKSDCWGFQAPPDAPLGSRYFNNLSPGHLRIDFGDKGREAASRWFRQRLDLCRGCVSIEMGSQEKIARVRIWGHPQRKILVVEVSDPDHQLGSPRVELSEWRPTMRVGLNGSRLSASEIQDRPARPHLVNTGMQEFFAPADDPLSGRGIGVLVSGPGFKPAPKGTDALAASLVAEVPPPAEYHFMVSVAVTRSGDPLESARKELDSATQIPLERLRGEHEQWWRDFWERSSVHVTSPDKKADRICGAYHVHLYTLGCVNRGPYPAKWDGGPGLMRADERNWGLSEWVQEIRFTYLPLYAANQLEIARGLTRHYSSMAPYLQQQTRNMWGCDGLWIPETTLPWGHAEDFVLRDDGSTPAAPFFQKRSPDRIPYGRFDSFNPYVGFLFTAGLEICEHYLTYYRYSGDETFLREDAYPILRGVCKFLTGLLRRESDGRYHLDPANALETWWLVRDPADVMSGIRAVFPEFIRLSQQYEEDAELRATCVAILNSLPDPPRGLWAADGKISQDVDVYAPAVSSERSHARSNAENPALYRVFPFGLSEIGSPDYALTCRTFEQRISPVEHGWSMDAIWAARLGLRDQACRLLAEHAGKFQRFPYGGWTSNDSRVFPGGLSAAPFMDAGGLSAFGLQEILLQSHGGVLRVAPATAKEWSGSFRLRAQNGFIVAADFGDGTVQRATITSLLGRECALASPGPGRWSVREQDRVIAAGDEPVLRFATRVGGSYVVEPDLGQKKPQ